RAHRREPWHRAAGFQRAPARAWRAGHERAVAAARNRPRRRGPLSPAGPLVRQRRRHDQHPRPAYPARLVAGARHRLVRVRARGRRATPAAQPGPARAVAPGGPARPGRHGAPRRAAPRRAAVPRSPLPCAADAGAARGPGGAGRTAQRARLPEPSQLAPAHARDRRGDAGATGRAPGAGGDRRVPGPAMIRATARLQLHAGFTLEDAAAQLDYYDALGISHLYLSPVTRARRGSTHGYDVIDHAEVNPELGGLAALRRLAGAARERGMGLILDIVPNHMAAHPDN